MSDYRDDTVETAVISDATWLNFPVLGRMIEDSARMAAALLVTISVLHIESATATDSLPDVRTIGWVEERASLSSDAFGVLRSASVTNEKATLRDFTFGKSSGLLVESAHMADAIVLSARDTILEAMHGGDQAWGTLRASARVVESARLFDRLVTEVRDLVADSASGADFALGRLRATVMVAESAHAADDMPEAHASSSAVVRESGHALDSTWGVLHASILVEEAGQGDALIVGADGGIDGQAWVSEADNWALSRYEPFGFHAATVVDGVVWLSGPDGLFALDGDAEEVEASLITGKVDVSGGALAVPLHSYIEYELQGSAEMTVSQTQGGRVTQSYTYRLGAKSADVLTNARFDFGRGLRGRHFTFELRMTGTAGYLNDWTTLIAPATRRI